MDEPVLLTGAGGRVGQAILERLGESYEWRLLDRRPPGGDPDHEFRVADVTDDAAVGAAMSGVGAVIHLAADPRPDAPWESVLENNIDGTQTVLQAAVEEGVEKVVFASSNHVVGHYETDRVPEVYQRTGALALDGDEPPRPSNLYGVSKASGEILARYYHDEYGLSIVCVRVGNLQEHHPPADYERGQAMWLSSRDCAHLFERCLEAEYEYEIVWGISDNEAAFYDLSRTRAVLDYQPVDDSASYE
jgi:NAD+ dependent glucose-6-phosphate dehydrogenase